MRDNRFILKKIKNGVRRAEKNEVSTHQDTKNKNGKMALAIEWSEEAYICSCSAWEKTS